MVFCNLVGRKFSKKSKHSVKCINRRIEPIRKKKQALVKFLKKDVADLLAGGHNENAFRRMDELIVEVNHASCYDMIEQYCGCVLAHLSTMRKERECPKEAMEAAATLIFAAARFSNLPELANLRTVFTERYGSPMETCINKEFIEKVHKKSFSKEKKLQLMEDIASEFSVNWNAKMLDTGTSHVQLAKHEPVTKELAGFNRELDSKTRESSPNPSIQKHQFQPDECATNNSTQRHRITVQELANTDSNYPDQKACTSTKLNQGRDFSNDSLFDDRISTNRGELAHSKDLLDAKDVMHRNGEGGRDVVAVNGANCGMANRRPPYVKYNVDKTRHVNLGDGRNPNGGHDDDNRKDGSVPSWDYDKLAAEISALRNS